MSSHQGVAALFSACVLADASRTRQYDWSLDHDKVTALLAVLALRLEPEDILDVVTYIYGKGGEPPVCC